MAMATSSWFSLAWAMVGVEMDWSVVGTERKLLNLEQTSNLVILVSK